MIEANGFQGNARAESDSSREGWARRCVPRVVILLGLLVLWDMVMIPPATVPPTYVTLAVPGSTSPPDLLTPRGMAQLGQDAAWRYLRSLEGGRRWSTVMAARAAVVRFDVNAKAQGTNESGNFTAFDEGFSGSGILVNGGRHLLVAGHVLDGIGKKDRFEYSRFECSALLADGTRRLGRYPGILGGAPGVPEGDWGLVEMRGKVPESCPSLEMRPVVPGSTVVLMGFSHLWAVDGRGTVFPSASTLVAPLHPLVFVGRMSDKEPGSFDIVAGSPIEGGMSGGAIIDLDGHLVGIGVTRGYTWGVTRGDDEERWEMDGSGSKTTQLDPGDPRAPVVMKERVFFGGTPVEVFREFVEKSWKR